MECNGTIKSIVETYELPTALEEKIVALASSRIPEYGISSFKSQYDLIVNLVDTYTRPYTDRYLKSLDERISDENQRSMHEIIGAPDLNLKELIQGRNQRRTVHAHEVVLAHSSSGIIWGHFVRDFLPSFNLPFLGGL